MDPLSSIRNTVSKELRKAYGSSGDVMLGLERADELDGAGDAALAGPGPWIVMVGFGATSE
jgi:hypothetical protein